ncbi:universal stress protein [Marivirga harenae]|uniref:universal stress protein n=1 Tax=Marivirga harenae TaxID=2010992 RepID=UPI0026DEE2C7|nr:universal stress protein [Marivirga harenae]WKV12454.1 universal stress protein [Marivirga harenae]|tara:strand:+ start:79497 stop:79931 length:435 start_codon:yes stop_codon:yes gene_type:complete
MKNIFVSIDFKEQEQLLLDKAFELAKAFDAKIWLVHIAAPEPDFVGYGVGPQYVRAMRASELREEHHLLQKYSQKLIKKGVESEALLVQGATVEMIIKEAKKLDADLIITGHHDHNFLYKAFMESVSNGLIKKSKIPLLLVPLI